MPYMVAGSRSVARRGVSSNEARHQEKPNFLHKYSYFLKFITGPGKSEMRELTKFKREDRKQETEIRKSYHEMISTSRGRFSIF